MKKNQRGFGVFQTLWGVAAVCVIAAATFHIVHELDHAAVKFTTPYQAVLLSNGSAYFGQIQGYGGPHPVLRDVFYIVSQTNPETKEVTPTLVKRGKEMHEPDLMYLNPSQILFVETVGTNSKVAHLIEQAHH